MKVVWLCIETQISNEKYFQNVVMVKSKILKDIFIILNKQVYRSSCDDTASLFCYLFIHYLNVW